jgi:16S rRNA (uracil1498-N3)-methyltransferase
LTLRGDEAHHARRALRLREGDAVTCFDGEGRGWRGRIDRYSGDTAFVTIESVMEIDRQILPRLSLAQSLVKGERMDLIVQKATELGVVRILPIVADRSDVRLDSERSAKRLERWRRIEIEAAKQCERLTLPAIETPTTLRDLLEAAREPVVVLVERDAMPIREVLQELGQPDSVMLIVGPEGGWSDDERSLFEQSGARCVSLGRGILRAETAAIAGLAVVRYALAPAVSPDAAPDDDS